MSKLVGRKARKRNLISEDELAQLETTDQAVADVITVDDFAPEELVRKPAGKSYAEAAE